MPPVFLRHAVSAVRLSIRDLGNLLVKSQQNICKSPFCVLSSHQISKKNTQIKTENYV